jgi:hypothetical protein
MCNDSRRRGGVKIEDAVIGYHCFNCGYSTKWEPGKGLSDKYAKFSLALGAPQSEINKVRLTLMQSRDMMSNYKGVTPTVSLSEFPEVLLPEKTFLVEHLDDSHPVKKYWKSRGLQGVESALWFDKPLWKDRMVLPFFYKEKLVGWTGRQVGDSSSSVKYLVEKPAGFVYNMDKFIDTPRNLAIVCEGVIDAALIGGLGLLTNSASPEQVSRINSLPQRIILCPDRDKAGKSLIDQALDSGWMVSFPPWDGDIKDVADAVSRYGRALTVSSIIAHATDNSTKIKVLKKIR